jgi:ADP-heptose:LPS heptosyltransferase
MPSKLLLHSHYSPGDIVVMTGAVRDLHHTYPGGYLTGVDTPAEQLWHSNPYITAFDRSEPDIRVINLDPDSGRMYRRTHHYSERYTARLAYELNVPLEITRCAGDVYLSDEERRSRSPLERSFGHSGPFWIIIAGGKYELTVKWWAPRYYQEVVDRLGGRVQFVQCGDGRDWHPPLDRVFNLVGKTSIRELVLLMYHAEGVICPITFAMHLAAAVPTKTSRRRPCVVIAGGREDPDWIAYPGHQFLHTVGSLRCCASGGCWRNRCQRVGDGSVQDREDMCEMPLRVSPDLRIPRCMAMVEPIDVVRAVEKFLAYPGSVG